MYLFIDSLRQKRGGEQFGNFPADKRPRFYGGPGQGGPRGGGMGPRPPYGAGPRGPYPPPHPMGWIRYPGHYWACDEPNIFELQSVPEVLSNFHSKLSWHKGMNKASGSFCISYILYSFCQTFITLSLLPIQPNTCN